VVKILEVEAVKAGLKPNEIIADITGGVKPMTAGMTLACVARNRNMQYMKVPRDKTGQVIPGVTPEPIRVPIRIDTAFVPAAGFPKA
jgi:hypothetical protein